VYTILDRRSTTHICPVVIITFYKRITPDKIAKKEANAKYRISNQLYSLYHAEYLPKDLTYARIISLMQVWVAITIFYQALY
jgi:hypothetical protein